MTRIQTKEGEDMTQVFLHWCPCGVRHVSKYADKFCEKCRARELKELAAISRATNPKGNDNG